MIDKITKGIKLVILFGEIIVIVFILKNLENFREIINPKTTSLGEEIVEKIEIIPTISPVLEKIIIPTKTEIKKNY